MNLKQCLTLVPPIWKSQSRIFGEACEYWVESNISCHKCSGKLIKLRANEKSIDCRCSSCGEEYQVKSRKQKIVNTKNKIKITGAEYKTTLSKIGIWNLIVIQYEINTYSVVDYKIIDKDFITASCVFPRKPLGPKARRAGWQGCYLIFENIS